MGGFFIVEKYDIYNDIAKRTGGDIYVGVVGPVRTGKSTFITKFMENLVIPNISNKLNKQIATDEMPQSADGKTIMTTQPKFVPANAVKIQMKNKATANVRLIDCVGYLIDGAVGHEENDKPRLVKTPWSNKEIPFEKAAEIGTKKVISEYSTIGILVTCDGSFTDIPRANYVSAEERVVKELKEIGKPFVIVLNSKNPNSEECIKLKNSLEEKYGVTVLAENVTELTDKDISGIIEKVLFEFPMQSFDITLPKWMQALPPESKIIGSVLDKVKQRACRMRKMKDFNEIIDLFNAEDKLNNPEISQVKLGEGVSEFDITAKSGLFYEVLSEECGDEIEDEYQLISYVKSLAEAKKHYSKIKTALEQVEETGYGIVTPAIDEMTLSEPELVKQGGRYGVKLKASAPSLHIMKVDVSTEISPLVGTERQGEDLVNYLLSEFESHPEDIWRTNMFGKPLNDLVNEGLASKITAMPVEAQNKMRKTLTKIVNEGRGGIICILL